jgi:hypothetical protein
MIDQAKNVLAPATIVPGHMADADRPVTTELADVAYSAIPAGGNGEVGRDSTGAVALPNGVVDISTPPYSEPEPEPEVLVKKTKTKTKAD